MAAHSSRFRGRKSARSPSLSGGDRTGRVVFSLSPTASLDAGWGKKGTAGEPAGRGFRRTGEGAGTCCVCERKAAKDEMAMLASVDGFWRGGEDCEVEGEPPGGRSDGCAACILLLSPVHLAPRIHRLHKMVGPGAGGAGGDSAFSRPREGASVR
jgi:hypothetical protein